MTAKNVSSSSATNQNVTAADEEAIATVPTQAGNKKPLPEEANTELTLIEGEKGSTKSFTDVAKKLFKNKKFLAALGSAAVVATAAFIKFNKQVEADDSVLVDTDEANTAL